MIHLTGTAKAVRERMWGNHIKVIILRTSYAQYVFRWHRVLPSREGEEQNSHLQTSGHMEETNIRGPVAEEGSLEQALCQERGGGVRSRAMKWLLWKPAGRYGRPAEQGDRAIRQRLIDRL